MMKALFKNLTVVLILLFGNLVRAQTSNTQNIIASFNTKVSQDFFLSNQIIATENNLAATDNVVYVSQIGKDNNLRSKTKSLESTIVIIQKGHQNNTILELNSAKLKEAVLQNGDNNTFLDYSLFKSASRNINVNQTGNNQNLMMLGTNSLSEKMKVSMQGQEQSIIIRNF